MTDLITRHAHATHLFCQLCSHIKRSVAKRSQSGRVAHVGVAVMSYPDPYIVPSISWSDSALSSAAKNKKKSVSSLAWTDPLNAAPESFYRGQIRCNPCSTPTTTTTEANQHRPPSKTFTFSTTHIFQSPDLPSQFVFV